MGRVQLDTLMTVAEVSTSPATHKLDQPVLCSFYPSASEQFSQAVQRQTDRSNTHSGHPRTGLTELPPDTQNSEVILRCARDAESKFVL